MFWRKRAGCDSYDHLAELCMAYHYHCLGSCTGGLGAAETDWPWTWFMFYTADPPATYRIADLKPWIGWCGDISGLGCDPDTP